MTTAARRRQGAPARREGPPLAPPPPPPPIPKRLTAAPGSAVYTITSGPALSRHQEPAAQRYPSGAALILPRPNLQHNCVSSGLFLAWESEAGCGEKAGRLPASPGRLFLYFTPCSNSALWKGIMALGCFSERRGKGYFTAALALKGPSAEPPSAGLSAPALHAPAATSVRGAYPYVHIYTPVRVRICERGDPTPLFSGGAGGASPPGAGGFRGGGTPRAVSAGR